MSKILTAQTGTPLENPTCWLPPVLISYKTRDVCYDVNKLPQFMHSPTQSHWSALKHLLQYLNGTIAKGILLHKDSPLNLHAFTNANCILIVVLQVILYTLRITS